MRRRGGDQAFFGNRSNRRRESVRGSLSWSGRNSIFDASPFSVNGTKLEKPSYSQNRFNASIGGQLRIPKVFESSSGSFFVNYSANRSNNPFSQFSTLPGATERAGDFSQTAVAQGSIIYDPLSQGPFAGNRVPTSRISPIAAGLLPLIPLPNQDATIQNYRIVQSIPQNSDNLTARISQSLTRRDRLSGSMAWQRREGTQLQLFGFADQSNGSGHNYDVAWSHTFTPRLINNVRVSYNGNRNTVLPFFAYGDDVAGRLGITGTSRVPVNYGPPNLNFTNYGDLTGAGHSLRRVHTFGVNEGLTVVRGKHTMRLGVDIRRLRWNNVAEQNARGAFTFSGIGTAGFDAAGQTLRNTGFDFADFLLGLPQQSSIRYNGADVYLRSTNYAVFSQEEWRVGPNLTLSLGLRYEYFKPFQEKYGRMSNLDIAPGFTGAAVVTGQSLQGPYSGAFPAGLIEPDRNNLSPRTAFAWKPGKRGKTIIRGGYSIFHDSSVFQRIPNSLSAQPPFSTTSSFVTSVGNTLTLGRGFVGASNKTVTNTFAVNRYFLVPYAQTWSMAVQRDMGRGYTLEGTYVGTKGTKLVLDRLPNRAAPGSPLTSEDRRQISNATGFTYESPEGNSVFHSGQLRFNRRMRRSMSFMAQYVLSKAIDNASTFGGQGGIVAQDDRNLAAERGLASFDRRHQFTFTAFVMSPRNTRIRLLRDWNGNIAFTAQTGTPLTASVLGTAANAAGSGATGSGRADATGQPVGSGSGYFNLAAFAVPPAGRFGNAGRNTIPGPGSAIINASFGKSFQLKDSRRAIEFRIAGDNVLNHVNITRFGTVVNAINYGLAANAGAMRSITTTLRLRF